MTRNVKSKMVADNYAPKGNQELKDFNPIDAESAHCPAPQLTFAIQNPHEQEREIKPNSK